MNTFLSFFYEFISVFFDGMFSILRGIVEGLIKMFNYNNYIKVVTSYKDSLKGPQWLLVGLSVAVLVVIVGMTIFLIVFGIRKLLKLRWNKIDNEELLEEISGLNTQVEKLIKEKDEIMSMKVSQLGLKPGEENTEEIVEEGESEEPKDDSKIRFPKLARIDEEYKSYRVKNYGNSFTLDELIDDFRSFSATKLHLYYDPSLLRVFVGGLSCAKLIILQGISGTGKTSLAYAWGKFVSQDSCIASVEPSWRDKTELLGYFNEFTKKFNETNVLAKLYSSAHDDDVHTIVLDEMNIARVEYYFAEMLSIMEMPSRDEWIIELVTNSWPEDPERIVNGKMQLPGNLWYVGTINNDDSTFMVTDKVYDRAMPIDINSKIDPFECREQDPININASYLEALFAEAFKNHPISKENIERVKEMDDYVITHFRVAFGNRIMMQMSKFVPVYVASGGGEVEAIDYFIAKKIFRKFDQLNIALIYDEIDPFIAVLNKSFGTGEMKECIEYLELIKKSV